LKSFWRCLLRTPNQSTIFTSLPKYNLSATRFQEPQAQYATTMSEDALHSPRNADHRVSKPHSSASPSNNSSLNPRSCVTCRRRKVKCNKQQPCSNCVKQHIECVFPAPGRAPRKPRKPQDSELIERLKRLEGVVQSLGVQVEEENPQSPTKDGTKEPKDEIKKEESHDERIQKACKELRELRRQQAEKEAAKQPTTGLENRFGRLVVEEGRSRYINPSFWANLSNEVRENSTHCSNEEG
jgi:Fungal Zn(2)-Cys(6) binuclear cluster domain